MDRQPSGNPPMTTCLCIGGLVAVVEVGAWVLTAETGDSRWIVLISSGTAIIVAACTGVAYAAPHLGRAITSLSTTIVPALTLAWKSWEEINKGTLSERIETLLEQNTKLQHTIEEDRERTEAANKKLQEMRNEFNAATGQHREQREALIAELGALKASLTEAQAKIDDLKEHDARLLTRVTVKQEHQAIKQEQQAAAISSTQAAVVETQAAVVENKAAIEVTAAAVEQINVEREAERSGDVPAAEPPKDERS
jgi:chromosome segregation ATPase